MSETTYPEPVGRLLTLGRPEPWDLWADYASMGLRRDEHAAELIRLASDAGLLDATEESPATWGPLHAWRALGQLGATEAIGPLLSLLRRVEENDDELVGEELPKVFGRIGIAALEPLRSYAADATNMIVARVSAAEAIKHIGMHPAHREPAAAALADLLEHAKADDRGFFNGYLVVGLCELTARQHIATIERAYQGGRIAERVCGKLPHVRAELGLEAPSATRRRFLDDDIDRAIDKVLPLRPAEEPTPDWMKEFLA
jgi:hypothetical protein